MTCLGKLHDECYKFEPNTQERKKAVKEYMDLEESLLDTNIKDIQDSKDPLIKRALEIRNKLPDEIKNDWPNPTASTLCLSSKYRQLWKYMDQEPPNLWIEVIGGSVFLHLHPQGMAFQFHWTRGNSFAQFVEATKIETILVAKTSKDNYGWFSTLYKVI